MITPTAEMLPENNLWPHPVFFSSPWLSSFRQHLENMPHVHFNPNLLNYIHKRSQGACTPANFVQSAEGR